MPALAGYKGSVLLTSTPNVALTDYVLTDAGDHKTFNVPSADFGTKRYWDRAANFVVQTSPDGVTWTTASAGTYIIRYVTGQVVFASAITGATPGCRIHSGAYLPFSTFGNMSQWEVTPQRDLADITTFGDKWKDYQPILIGAEAKLEQFYADATLFNVVSSNNLFVVSMMTGRTSTERYEGFARMKNDDVKAAVSAVITESLDCSIDGQLYYFAGQYS